MADRIEPERLAMMRRVPLRSGTVPVEVAVLGVDEDCGVCAQAGIERLMAVKPNIDWYWLVHEIQQHAYERYWCPVCATSDKLKRE